MKETIKLNELLQFTPEELASCKLHLAATYPDGTEPLDVFSRSFDEWVGWNESRSGRNDFNRPYIFSLIEDYHHPGKYIFGGLFRVVERFEDGYKVALETRLQGMIGRLVIDFYRYQGLRGRAYLLEHFIEEMTVSEIHEKPYDGLDFPGYDNIRLDFPMLERIVLNSKADWKTALENVKAVYLICDKSNGKKYVGSAYGMEGLWQRWCCYAGSVHGYNDDLVALIDTKGIDYARKNFQFSVLEVFTMKKDNDAVIARESFWKDVLLTRGAFGYNKN
ncbi:MAG: GIY-YIG nuclease family protein [Bacteroidales bacterium]|nr:GIY-YIG nuclease family protein [Bacteroidales bacterium]